MPYNTRRKSLSLADLGVVVPKRSRTQSHPSPPSTIVEGEESDRPTKFSKKSHGSTSPPPPGLMSPPRKTVVRIKEEQPKQELSPPPSPAAEACTKVNLEGLSDDIVRATIEQLEQTRNRPIFVKELAAVLATRLHSVEKSANPSALISSRLTSYLNRSWPAISPCPLAKDLSPVHPRRLYFYLTTMPRQPVPEPMEILPKANRIISPSLSSASVPDEDDEQYDRSRQVLSPSPEVDLCSPELEDEGSQEPPTPGAPFSGRNSVSRDRSSSTPNLAHNRRAASPQLEHEERDFKQTASALHEQAQQRRNSQSSEQDVDMEQLDASAGAEQETTHIPTLVEESEESVALKRSEAAEALFGHTDHLKAIGPHTELFSSPLIQPQTGLRIEVASSHPEKLGGRMGNLTLDHGKLDTEVDILEDWDALQSPENIELAELEDLFDAY